MHTLLESEWLALSSHGWLKARDKQPILIHARRRACAVTPLTSTAGALLIKQSTLHTLIWEEVMCMCICVCECVRLVESLEAILNNLAIRSGSHMFRYQRLAGLDYQSSLNVFADWGCVGTFVSSVCFISEWTLHIRVCMCITKRRPAWTL